MSTLSVPVVEVKLEPHPNADSLSIVHVFGYTVVVRTEDWHNGDLAAYVPVDSIVDIEREEFSWLDKPHIKARKLRGILSQGILIPLENGHFIGDDLAQDLGVTKYIDPPPKYVSGAHISRVKPPWIDHDYTDIQNLLRYPNILQLGEEVVITEKVDGTNARFTYRENQLWVGSHRLWRAQDDSVYWRVVTPEIENYVRSFDNAILYGEIYGWIQPLRYGCKAGEIKFAAFDVQTIDQIYENTNAIRYMNEDDNVPFVPVLYEGPYLGIDHVQALAEQDSRLCKNHMMEGVIIKPVLERWNEETGRTIFKLKSSRYLLGEK